MNTVVNIQNLVSDDKCYETVRDLRWPSGVCCAHCKSKNIKKRGKNEKHFCRQRYFCHDCHKNFDDLTNTVFSGHHQPLKTWITCLYLMGLNISNHQISQELSLNRNDVHDMTSVLRAGVVERKPQEELSGEVEFDEVYIVAGHKGNPDAVKKRSVLLGDVDLKGQEVEVH